MIVNREVRHHPAMRGRVGLGAVAYTSSGQRLLEPLGHLGRIAAVFLGGGYIDFGRRELRREKVGAGRHVGREIASVEACNRREAIGIGSRRRDGHAAAHAETHRAHPAAHDIVAPIEIAEIRLGIFGRLVVARRGHQRTEDRAEVAREDLLGDERTIGTVAVEGIRQKHEIAAVCKPLRHVKHARSDPAGVRVENHRRPGPAARRDHDVRRAIAIVRPDRHFFRRHRMLPRPGVSNVCLTPPMIASGSVTSEALSGRSPLHRVRCPCSDGVANCVVPAVTTGCRLCATRLMVGAGVPF